MFSYFNYIWKTFKLLSWRCAQKYATLCSTVYLCLKEKYLLSPHATRRSFAGGHKTRTMCPSTICLLLFLLRSPSHSLFSPPRICVCCRSSSSRSLGQKKLLLLEIKFCEQKEPKEPERRHGMWHVRRLDCHASCSFSIYLLFFYKTWCNIDCATRVFKTVEHCGRQQLEPCHC